MSASRGLAPREGIEGLGCLVDEDGSYGLLTQPRRGPQAGRSGDPRSQNTDNSLSQVTLEQENSLLKGIIEKGVYKSLAGSKQFEKIVHKQGRHRKNQGDGFERKFNANGVEWE